MIERVIDISEQPLQLSVAHANLVLSRDGNELERVPLDEVAVLLLHHPATRLYATTLSRLAEAGAMVVTTDERHLPSAMLLPLQAHWRQTGRMATQIQQSLPQKKRIWQSIVRAKIRAQAALLTEIHGDDGGLDRWTARVRSGDPDNVEAQAARHYWGRLFEGRTDPATPFRRQRHGPGPNPLLNYGYAVLRAAVARSICAAGLHPSIGLHHHNQANPFCLADDLMEPFRPIIDRVVADILEEFGPRADVDRESRHRLVGTVLGRFRFDGEDRKLFDHLSRTTASLVQVMEGREKKLQLPVPLEPATLS